MFSKDKKITMCGIAYDLVPLSREDIVEGTYVRLKHGTVMRRVLGLDGDDVILRSVRSSKLVEAISMETLLDEWLLMVEVKSSEKHLETI